MLRFRYLIILIVFITPLFSVSQGGSSLQISPKSDNDTVILSIQDAEQLFLDKNFELLAARYQISEADAAVIQAKLWANPTFNIEQGAYNPETKKWFDFSATGETALSLQQLFVLAGKRNKRISSEKINSQIAKYQFYDLMRVLRHELRVSFYGLYFLQQSISVYDRELLALKTLVDAYTAEYQKGNVSFNELARLQSLQFNLENEKIEVLKNVTENQSNLVLLIGDTTARQIKPLLDASQFDHINPSSLTYIQLLDSGLNHRYDIKISAAQIQSEQNNLSLQKAMRVPDITLGANYDKAGNYIQNYNSLSLSFDLPVLNQNQGNIKIAENKIEESKALKKQCELEVRNEINKAYVQLIETDRLYKSSLQQFDRSYDKLLDGINFAYQNHTISLLEFIDYYETYKNSKNGFYNLQNNRLDAIEDLNMASGTIVIK
ncbi:MAG: TolC family protein [Bacteroidetes bacterium]|nr:TolC family protein [Bacteroidota bacterium]